MTLTVVQAPLPRQRHRDQPFAGQCHELKPPSVPQRRPALPERDLDVPIFKRRSVERMDRLVDGLLGDKDEPLLDAVALRRPPFGGAQHEVDEIGRQRFGRLDVDPKTDDWPTQRDGGDGEVVVMRERTDDAVRPCRRAGGRAQQRRGGVGAELSEEVPRDDAGGAARATSREVGRAAQARTSERRLVAGADAANADKDAKRPESGAERRAVEAVAPRSLGHAPRQRAAAGALETSLAGLPRQRDPAGVTSPFIRKASASSRVLSPIVTP